jgi:hypothetical protein
VRTRWRRPNLTSVPPAFRRASANTPWHL